MPCDMRRVEELAEQGWNPQEIEQLRKEVELARAEANTEAYEMGLTLTQQREMEARAERKARKIAHDRFHAKLERAMEEIRNLGDAKVAVHANHADAHKEVSALGPAERAKLKLLLES